MDPDSQPAIGYFKGSRCGFENCNSAWYYIEEGFTYCKKGHQKEIASQGPQTQPEEDDFIPPGRTTRQKKEVPEQVSQIYSGPQAVQLYLQSYQLILWKQCYALIHTVGLPAEIETVVKDLWALRLQLLKNKIDPESEGNAVFSSQPESEKETERRDERKREWKREWKVRGKDMPTLIESLGLCYLGMVLLRLPVSLGDVYRWAVKEYIPFIRAIRFIPKVMKSKLPAEYIKALDTQSVPTSDGLYKSVHRLVLFYDHRFGIILPPLNHHLLLFQHVKNLALPLEICLAVHQICSLLDIKFTFPRPGSRQKTSSFPETRLIALVVIALKIYHPFDGLDRYSRSITETGILSIDWNIWYDLQTEHEAINSAGKIGRGNEMLVNEMNVMEMSDAQLDEYLDWSEKTWVDEESLESRKRGLPKQLLDMFPTGRLDGSSPPEVNFVEELMVAQASIDEKLNGVQGSLLMRGVISEEREGKSKNPVRRIGSFYKRYRKMKDLTPHARKLHETVASLVGISLSTLLIAVLQIERQLQLWRRNQQRKKSDDFGEEASGNETEIEIDDDGSSYHEEGKSDEDDGGDQIDASVVEGEAVDSNNSET